MNNKRLSKVSTSWSSYLAYAVGLITADGNLSPDGRHINFTTKDIQLAQTFRDCLSLTNKIGVKARGGSKIKLYFVVQFGDKNFYNFLTSIGLTTAKSKTIEDLNIPDKFYADFLRGCIDGDGNICIANHPESRLPQLRVRLFSGSKSFLLWVLTSLRRFTNVKGGWIYTSRTGTISTLSFGKSDSTQVLRYIYYHGSQGPLLTRKYNLALPFIS